MRRRHAADSVRIDEVYLTESHFVMGRGASFTVSIVSSTTHSFVDEWWYVDGALYH